MNMQNNTLLIPDYNQIAQDLADRDQCTVYVVERENIIYLRDSDDFNYAEVVHVAKPS